MFIGIDIGGTKCAVTKGTAEGEILKKIKFPTSDCQQTLKQIYDAVGKMGEAQAIGISCGGPLDAEKGIIMSPPNLPGWDNVCIVDMLEKKFNIPTFLQNDANACALAEWKFGAGKGTRNMVFFTFGTGLGAGLILDGKLYSGTCGMAGEAGHIRLDNYGPVGYGKEGSFEGFCSGGGLAQLGKMVATRLLQQGKKPSFCMDAKKLDTINAKSIADCAKEGHEDALEVYRICGQKLGQGLAIIIDILNPQKIILGSIYARSYELLYDEMMMVLKRECLPQALKVCEIVPAGLGEEIGDWAALSVATEGVKNDR